MKLISVIVINYNGAGDLPSCLESIAGQDYPDIELILIDNRSTDSSPGMLESFAADAARKARFAADSPTLISSEVNAGFSAALNRGIEASSGEFIMPLNTDVVMAGDFVRRMVDAIEDDPTAGSVSGKLLRFPPFAGDNVIDSAGHVMFRNRLATNRGEGRRGTGCCTEKEEVFGTCGAAALYRMEMLDDIRVCGEWFDEDFFAFWEDLDVDWRARIRGWRCLYEPAAVAWHRRGGAGYRKSLLVEYHNFKNRFLLVMKNDSPGCYLRNLPGILLTDTVKAAALLLRCPRALLSLLEVARLLPVMLAKRRLIQSRRVVSAAELEGWFQPFDYPRWFRRHLLNRGGPVVETERPR